MPILIAGASGATGRLLVKQLLDRGLDVRAIVRSPETLPDTFKNNEHLSIIHAGVLDMSDAEMARHVDGCSTVASCLGHNLTMKGIFSAPHMLVTEATRRLCNAIKSNRPERPVKFILMNTAGNSNRDLNEQISFSERCVMGLIRKILPPHVDNEKATDFLRMDVGQDDKDIEWVVVRPDTLINEDRVTEYDVHPSPIRSAIFNAGKTSRINVAHFMSELITDADIWSMWKGRMPVIYNKDFTANVG